MNANDGVLADVRLTDEELITVVDAFDRRTDGEGAMDSLATLIADAATDKALRGVVAWLRSYGPSEEFVAKELEALLKEEQARG